MSICKNMEEMFTMEDLLAISPTREELINKIKDQLDWDELLTSEDLLKIWSGIVVLRQMKPDAEKV